MPLNHFARLSGHVHRHPVRLLVTAIVIVVISWTAAGVALILAFDAAHQSDVAVCRSVNELRREIYVAAADLGVQASVRERFLPAQDCESLP